MTSSFEAPPRGPRLRIVGVNDVYALDNLPRLRSLVRHHAAVDPADVLLVTLAGDFVAPSILSSLDSGRGMVDCLRAVGITHAIFGNHEDDIPTEELRRRIRELGATWLNTNARGFDPPLPAHQVIEVGGAGGRRVRVAEAKKRRDATSSPPEKASAAPAKPRKKSKA